MAKYQGKYIKKAARKRSGLLSVILLLVFTAMMAVGGWKLFSEQQTYRVGSNTYEALAATAVKQYTPEEAADAPVPFETEISAPDDAFLQEELAPPGGMSQTLPVLQVDFPLLQSVNSQIVGWIFGSDGAINYPVVLGGDNSYYLRRLVDGTPNQNGSIFMDYRNAADLSHRNTFIYGHNMKNGTMFASLSSYASPEYYRQHPELILVMPDRTWCLQVFSGYVTPGNSDIYQIDFESEEEFAAYLERVKSFSDITTDVQVTTKDRIVTLSTCTYDYEDARYVLHCKLVPMQ